ncbi:MAG: hypothetical protein NZ839_04920, partial [Endomicrobia bacterium]|nr:hypothetical protein [Endomicrobiia bacterium]
IIKTVLAGWGFKLNLKKIRFMHPGRRKEVTGLCVNAGYPTVSRKFRRKVRAAVHNYITKGQGDINQIKGWLAFLAGIPAHREKALQDLKTLKEVEKRRK